MLCTYFITGAPLNLAVIDAFVEHIINGFWFFLLFEVFNKYKDKKILSGVGGMNSMSEADRVSRLAPINNKKHSDL